MYNLEDRVIHKDLKVYISSLLDLSDLNNISPSFIKIYQIFLVGFKVQERRIQKTVETC